MPSEKKFYLTTPIYYVNARPHIGHAYSTIVADVIARRHRLLGDDTYFLTGTDEHGQKIERSAAAAGIPPQEFADQVSKTFSDLWKRMGMLDDNFSKDDPLFHRDFIRTTSERHKKGVQKLFSVLLANGAIEEGTYTGQYCVSDEAYVEVGPGEPCPDCGRITETISESNYYFKLSAYADKLEALIASNELLIQPDSRRNEILSFVRSGLKDLSISRTSFKWGIPVPGDESHVIYVWLDALANYMTAVGYGSDAPEDIAKFERYWPADLHLVGKEIIRFHCVYWPAFLLAANLPLPKSIVANGWLLFEDSKMSKSRGNVVRTETILDAFGSLCPPPPPPLSSFAPQTLSSFAEGGGSAVPSEAPQLLAPTKQQQDLFATDVLRYFLLREIPFGQDGSFSFDALVQRYNADLANGYGNLVSRVLSMIGQYFEGSLPPYDLHIDTKEQPERFDLNADAMDLAGDFEHYQKDEYLRTFLDFSDFDLYLQEVFKLVAKLDGFLTRTAPWKLAKSTEPDSRADLGTVLFVSAQCIRLITALLYPVIPYSAAQVWNQLGLGDIEVAVKTGKLKNLKWNEFKPSDKLGSRQTLFPSIKKEDIPRFIQTMIATEENNAQAAKPTPATEAGAPLLDSEEWASTAPDSPPRTGSFTETAPGAHVAASAAITTERPGTPPHTEAPASAPFANAAAASAIPDTPQIAIDDFVKIDLRVARILVAERIPKADKLLRLEVDLGYERRQILSGIAEWYTPEELVGRTIVVIANLAPRKMRGLESHGMLLAASHGENGKPVLATFGEEIALGSRLR